MIAPLFSVLLAGAPAPDGPAPDVQAALQADPPADCASLLAVPASGILGWRDTMTLEHCDRTKRLMRLSEVLPRRQAPLFFDTLVSSASLPTAIGADVPLLRVVFPERVFFRTGSDALTPAAREVVRIVADSLRAEPPDVTLFVAGHADARGDRAFNQALSVDRANALAAAIAAEGTGVATLWRVGFGEDMPLAAGTSSRAYGLNRRVEFLFAARPEAVGAWLSDQQLDLLCTGRSASATEGCRDELMLAASYEAAEVAGTDRARVDPAAGSVSIDLSGTRRIRIDPVNRKADEAAR